MHFATASCERFAASVGALRRCRDYEYPLLICKLSLGPDGLPRGFRETGTDAIFVVAAILDHYELSVRGLNGLKAWSANLNLPLVSDGGLYGARS